MTEITWNYMFLTRDFYKLKLQFSRENMTYNLKYFPAPIFIFIIVNVAANSPKMPRGTEHKRKHRGVHPVKIIKFHFLYPFDHFFMLLQKYVKK